MKANTVALLSLTLVFLASAALGLGFTLTNIAFPICLRVSTGPCLQFVWTSGDRLLDVSTAKCLGAQGKTQGSGVSLYDCDEDSELQKWECRNTYRIALKGQELYIYLSSNSDPKLTRSAATILTQFRIKETGRAACTETFRELFTIGGNANGRPCMFPFFYKDKWYSDCTKTDDINGQDWCSVQTKSEKELWGYCPTQSREQWTKHPVTGAYYQINDGSTLTWSQAKKSCNQQGASLLSITDPHEHAYITGLLSRNGAKLWNGLTFDSEHGWHWSDERPYRYINWDSDYPIASPGHVCGFLHPDSTYAWQNAPCSRKLGYICYSGPTLQRPTPMPEDDTRFCSSPWIPYNGHCFLLSRDQKTWLDAQAECRSQRGDLVSIHNVEEQGFVISQLGFGPSDELWIGLNDRRIRRLFDWSDHSTVSFTSWEFLKPDVKSNKEKCVLVRGERGKWADRSCEEKHGFICMKPSATHPTGDEVDVNSGCKTGWKRHGSYCYLVGTQTKTFEEAGEHCKSSGSYLADVSNGVDNAFLVSLVGTRPEKYFWLGLSNQKDAEVFEWTNTPFVKFTHWNAEMPGTNKGCVAMTTGIFAGLWDVLPCTNKEKYICKHLAEGVNLTPAPPTQQPPRCEEGWTRVGKRNVCFKEFLDSSLGKKGWYEAREYCQAMRGDLLSLHSVEDLAALPNKYASIWIGLSAPDTKTYVWSDGSPLQFQHWASGQPDNKNSVESCVELNLDDIHNNGSWSDVQCEKQNGWLCQIAAGLKPKTPPTPSPPDYNVTADGWLEWRGHQYYFSSEKKAMEDARHYCKQRHGDLVTIQSAAENLFLWRQVGGQLMLVERLEFPSETIRFSVQIHSTSRDNWIGLNVELDGSFQWMDGSLMTFVRWGENQPLFKNNDELCAILTTSTGFWQDQNCGREFDFICKRSSSAPANTTVVPPTEPPMKGGCPEQWEKLNSRCYRIVDDSVETWEGAQSKCSEMGGKLTSIVSRHEHVFLMSKMAITKKTDLWLGLTADDGNIVYWTDGRALKYSAFNSAWNRYQWYYINEWQNVHYFTDFWKKKQCFVMSTRSKRQIGTWMPASCNDTNGYICQRKVDPSFKDVPTVYTDYIKLGNDSFKVIQQKLAWDDAKKRCEDDGATLASVLDKRSETYVSLMAITFNAAMWIGLRRTKDDGHFQFIDGWQMTVFRWGWGEPSRDRHCVYVDTDERWRTAHCNRTAYGVCRKSTAVAPTSPSVHPGVCPDTYTEWSHTAWLPFKGYCYKFIDDRQWWTDASGYCRIHGGHLASIVEPDEQKFIETHAKMFEDSFDSFWIGLYKTRTERWLWEDTAVVDYINMQLNNSGIKDYGALRTSDGTWHTDAVYMSKPFICKMAKVMPPSPSPTAGTSIGERRGRSHIAMAAVVVVSGLGVGLLIIFAFYQKSQRPLPAVEHLTNFDNPLFFSREEPEVAVNKLLVTADDHILDI
ncbi:macrophage mannose receptor 1-like isoform 2-T2 [Synchiropus picturatus]